VRRSHVAAAVVAMTCIGGLAWGQEAGSWRAVSAPKFTTKVWFDTVRVKQLGRGRVEVWEKWTLKTPRHDPDGMVATVIMQVVVDCAAEQSALKSIARYSPDHKLLREARTFMVRDDDFTTENAGTVEESVLKGVCGALHLPKPPSSPAR